MKQIFSLSIAVGFLAILIFNSAPVLADEPPQELPDDRKFNSSSIDFSSSTISFSGSSIVFSESRMDSADAEAILAARKATGENSADESDTAPSALEMTETDTEIRFRLTADLLFDFDKSELRSEATSALQELVAQIRDKLDDPEIRIEGHTDSKGSDAYNQTLSEQRAEVVRDWLIREGKVPASKISASGYGENRAIAPNTAPDGSDNPEGRQKNRRVEVIVNKP